MEGLTDGTEDVKWSSNVIKGKDAEENAEAWVKYDLGTEKEYKEDSYAVYEAALTQANLLMAEKNAQSQEAVTKVSSDRYSYWLGRCIRCNYDGQKKED